MIYTPRDYQIKAFDEYMRLLRAGFRRPILFGPCGSGKTVLACMVIEAADQRQRRILFLAHRKKLIEQGSDKLTENGIPHGIIKAGIGGDPYAAVQVASVQTLHRRLDTLRQDYDVVITDECHHAPSKSYTDIMERSPRAFHIGLTATPYRADGQGMAPHFDSIITVATVSELTDQCFLVPARVFEGVKVDLSRVPKVAHDYNQGALDEVMNTPKIVGDAVKAWIKHASDRLTVYFTAGVAASKALVEAFALEGYNFAHLDGNTQDDERAAIHAQMKAREICGICNCGVLTEGYDCPEISCIGILRPTQSKSLAVQIWGRGLRPADGKVDCIIMDHANVRRTHGDVTDPVNVTLKAGVSKGRERPARKCRECGATYAGQPSLCPVCGAELRQGGERVDEEISLGDPGYEMVETRPRHPQAGGRRYRLNENQAAAMYLKDRKKELPIGTFKRGFAFAKYKGMMGEPPPDELQALGDSAA